MNQHATERTAFPLSGRVFLSTVILAGLAVILLSVRQLYGEPLPYQWYMLAALALISGSATVKVPSVPATISVSETFVFALVLLFGPAAGTVTVALDGLVSSYWIAKRRPEWYRALFNMTAPAISIWLASQILFAQGLQPLYNRSTPVNSLLVPLTLFTLADFGLNSWLIALAVSLETRRAARRIWRDNFLWLSLNYFAGASVALLLVLYSGDVDLRFIGVVLPLLIAVYFMFRTVNQRVDDAERHVLQLNRTYLSTIETLAMAIDAKDQITHGHIRRVQTIAINLAREIGISDELQLKALEAAALLHDMGKIAVPEHILNKPGQLTPAEFEKMKLHATVGADILAAIEFPYPVVPIVRHHHENWNGTGYPAGLCGTDIPIGARILSVVDCFDALTSNRPYRRSMTVDAAVEILLARRGKMYDPLVVDTFVSSRDKILASMLRPENTDIACETSLAALPISSRDLAGHQSDATVQSGSVNAGPSRDTGSLAQHVLRIMSCQLCVFYMYDATTDDLVVGSAAGEGAEKIYGLRISLGKGLSGWVAANRRTILNSDAGLDLANVGIHPVPLMCLSAPILVRDTLIGVLSAYSTNAEGFTEQDRQALERFSADAGRDLTSISELQPAMRLRRGLPTFAV